MTEPWFHSVAELHDLAEPEALSPDGYEAAQAIMDASVELGGGRVILMDLRTDTKTRYVAMPFPHRHDQRCNRA